MSESSEKVKVPCDKCGGGFTNHEILQSHRDDWQDEYEETWGVNVYEIVRCLGCESVRFRQSAISSEYRDPITGEHEACDVRVYPPSASAKNSRRAPISSQYPELVSKIYLETVACFNSGANTLAGGGLRAIVEAICKDKNIDGRDLKIKIDELVRQGFLAQAQADLLHEERYIGNAALHEMLTPSRSDLEDGLKIVEGLMNTIYDLPIHAERLRQRREARKTSQSSPNAVHDLAGGIPRPEP